MVPPKEQLDLAWRLQKAGHLPQAEYLYRQVLEQDPTQADVWTCLGSACQGQGRFAEAVNYHREAIRLRPDEARYHNNLGNALTQLGRPEDALPSYTEAVRLRPDYALAHSNLGNACIELGRLPEAVSHLRQALRLQNDLAQAYNNLGYALQLQGQAAEALEFLKEAVRRDPRLGDAHVNLGNLLWECTYYEEAERHFREAVRCQPDGALAHTRLGEVLADRGEVDEASKHLRRAQQLRPTPHRRLTLDLLLPPIYRSLDEVSEVRQRLQQNLRRLHEEGVRVDLTQRAATTLFYLAYQGQNDRDLLRSVARLCIAPVHDLPPRPPRTRPRVAFLSRHFRVHTVGDLLGGLIARLPRSDFEVVVFTLGHHDDATTAALRSAVEHFVRLPLSLPAARDAILRHRPDVLCYTDLGMDAVSSALAHSRLAPVQCVTWGHPSTSGIDTVDYFLSSELFEPPDADAHYSEKLVRLKSLPCYFSPPGPPQSRKTRSDLGLPDDAHLYASPQSLFKLHPAFDTYLAGILRADPRGLIVLNEPFGSFNRPWVRLLQERFARTLPDVAARVMFLPRLEHDDYLRLHELADVLLDPPQFNGGYTSLKGLAMGAPIVTQAGPLLRSRMTLGLYRRMGVSECVAESPEDYVARAVRLGTDTDYRRQVRERIVAARAALYEDRQAIVDVAAFLGTFSGRRGSSSHDLGASSLECQDSP